MLNTSYTYSVDGGILALKDLVLPTQLFCLGQTVVSKGTLIIFEEAIWTRARCRRNVDTSLNLIYGINDRLALEVVVPAVAQRTCSEHSSGLGDISAQLEWAFYQYSKKEKEDWQATVLAAVLLPTGSICKSPETGFGSTSVLLGTTGSFLTPLWYLFYSTGGILTTTNNQQTKFGNTILYEAGVGRSLYTAKKYLLFAFIECNGILERPTRISGILQEDTGNHVLFVGPSFFFSTQHATLQIGIQGPITQTIPNPSKISFRLGLSVSWFF